jgi:hypothetical protein
MFNMLCQIFTIRERPKGLRGVVPKNCSIDHQIIKTTDLSSEPPDPDSTVQSVIGFLNNRINQLGRPFPVEKFETVLFSNLLTCEDEVYDIVNPFLPKGRFGDMDQDEPSFKENMVFDLIRLRIAIYDAHSIKELSLEALLQKNVTLEDFVYVRSSMPPIPLLKEFHEKPPGQFNWIPEYVRDQRVEDYLGILLTTFGSAWSHLFTGYYNQTTTRVIAKAIITILLNSFTIEEQLDALQPASTYQRD